MDSLLRWFRFLFDWSDVIQPEIDKFTSAFESEKLLKREQQLEEYSLQDVSAFLPPCPVSTLAVEEHIAQMSIATQSGQSCLDRLNMLVTRLEHEQSKEERQELTPSHESIQALEARVEELEALKREKLRARIRALEEELAEDAT